MKRLIYVVLCFVICACGSRKTSSDISTDSKVIFKRTVCYGTCPIYEMTVTGSGLITFVGDRFTPKIGRFTKQLSPEETNNLFNALNEFAWEGFNENYPTGVSDLPSTIVEFNYKDVHKKVSVTGEHPPELDVIHNILIAIAESDGWMDENSQ